MKKKIYIAGAVTGQPFEEVQMKFKNKADELKAQGHDAHNPFYEVAARGMVDAPYSEIMRVCIADMLGCDEVHLMTGWEHSRGANIERNIARMLEMPIVYPQ